LQRFMGRKTGECRPNGGRRPLGEFKKTSYFSEGCPVGNVEDGL